RNPPRNSCDETGRRRTLVPLGKHLMHGGKRQPAAQHRVGALMPERDLVQPVHIAMGFDALDAAAQGRKRAHACAVHASPLRKKVGPVAFSEKTQKPAQFFMIFSNKKQPRPKEQRGNTPPPIHEWNQGDSLAVIPGLAVFAKASPAECDCGPGGASARRVPGIHVFLLWEAKTVNGRAKPDHDEWRGPCHTSSPSTMKPISTAGAG